MITAQESLEAFFREKAMVYAQANVHLKPIFEAHFGEPISERIKDFLLPDAPHNVIEHVQQNGNLATIITCTRLNHAEIRNRYTLEARDENWKIVRLEHECPACRIHGKSSNCPHCGGEGWHDLSRQFGKK